MKTVLITSGIDDFTRRFHELPSRPVAIIELDKTSTLKRLKLMVRSALGLVLRNRFDSLKRYCARESLAHVFIDKRDKSVIEHTLNRLDADLVITYRCPIVPTQYLTSLKHGAINLHASLLPAFRGGDPLFWQVVHGVKETGVTVHRLSDVIDEGPILKQVSVERPVNLSEQALSHLLNVEYGFEAISDVVQGILDGTATAIPQPPVEGENLPTAPNGKRAEWQALSQTHNPGADGLQDVAAFLGVQK